jgi:hypothetical protein
MIELHSGVGRWVGDSPLATLSSWLSSCWGCQLGWCVWLAWRVGLADGLADGLVDGLANGIKPLRNLLSRTPSRQLRTA